MITQFRLVSCWHSDVLLNHLNIWISIECGTIVHYFVFAVCSLMIALVYSNVIVGYYYSSAIYNSYSTCSFEWTFRYFRGFLDTSRDINRKVSCLNAMYVVFRPRYFLTVIHRNWFPRFGVSNRSEINNIYEVDVIRSCVSELISIIRLSTYHDGFRIRNAYRCFIQFCDVMKTFSTWRELLFWSHQCSNVIRAALITMLIFCFLFRS